jgi:hypothetical protein
MGRDGGQSRLPKTLCRTLFLYLSLATLIVGTRAQANCAANAVAPVVKGVTVEHCQQIVTEKTFTVWYKRDNSTSPTTLSFIVSVPQDSRWYAMGFNSAPSSMVGTTALIFWVDPTTTKPTWSTYHITSHANAGITNTDTGLLSFTVQPTVHVNNSNYVLGYVVQETPGMIYQNFAVSPQNGVPNSAGSPFSGLLHDYPTGEAAVTINFITGVATQTTGDPLDGKKKTHGILNVIGWGVLLPLGAIIARYAKGFDPQWFYMHAAFQITGYGLILAGLVTGVDLQDEIAGVDIGLHRGLGILIFVLATVQISAVLYRPDTNHKLRRYWNWGHWWFGRIALVIAAINIFVGIHLGIAGRKWRVGYGVVLALELFVVVILEARLWFNYARKQHEPRLPQTDMQRQGPAVNGSGPTAPPAYESNNWDGKL